MNRDDFINSFHDENLKTMTKDEIDDAIYDICKANRVMKQDYSTFPDAYNFIIIIEEMSELIKELTKSIRRKGDSYNLLEEMADVQICLYELMQITCTSKETLDKAVTIKLNRIKSALDENGWYQ